MAVSGLPDGFQLDSPKDFGSLEQGHNLPSGILNAVMKVESGGDPNAVSPVGAKGPFQFMDATAASYGIDPTDINQAAPAAAAELGSLYKKYGGDVNKTLAAYNWGQGNVDKHGLDNAPAETQNYIQKVSSQIQTTDPHSLPEGFQVDALPPGFQLDQQKQQLQQTFDQKKGDNLGQGSAYLTGLSNIAPLGPQIQAGIGALATKPIDALTGNFSDNRPLSEIYDQLRNSQQVTSDANPVSSGLGNATALAGGLGAAFSNPSVVASTPVIGDIANAVTQAGTQVGNFVRGGQVANDAGFLAKAANLGGQALRSGAASAIPFAAYSANSAANGQELDKFASNLGPGFALGAALPVAGAALGAVGNVISPKIDEATAALAQQAQKLGIPLRVDQIADSPVRTLGQKLSKDLPFSGSAQFEAKQVGAFNKAVANTFGAEDLTPDGVNGAIEKISGLYKSALSGKTVDVSELPSKLDEIVNSAKSEVPNDVVNIIHNNVDNINKSLGNGTIDGDKIAAIRSQLVQKLKSVTPQAKGAISNAIDAIDQIITPQIGEQGATQLQQAGRFWRNYKTVDPLLEKATDGTISPSQLINRVASSPYIDASRTPTGQDALVDLARIGKEFLPKLGGSDTASKIFLGAGGAGLVNPATTIPTAATIAANRGYQSLYNTSPSIVKSIVNKSLPSGNSMEALQQAFLARKGR